MSALLREFRKLAMGTRELLELDPQTMHADNLQHNEILNRKAEVVYRLHHGLATPEEEKLRGQMTKQVVKEGLKSSLLIGLGTGLGFGAMGAINRNKGIRKFLSKHQGLAFAVGAAAAGGSILAAVAKRKEQERRLARAYNVLDTSG